MKKYVLYLCFVIVVLGSFVFMSNTRINETSYTPFTNEVNNNLLYSSGSPGGLTGSLGDEGKTCTSCHDVGTAYNLAPTITTNIPETGYELDVSYTITVTATSDASRHGFELTAEKDADYSKVGEFNIIGSTGSPQLISGGDGAGNVTHSNNTSTSWSFNWTASGTDEGSITFYAAVLAGNGSGTNNDQTVTQSLSMVQNTLSIS